MEIRESPSINYKDKANVKDKYGIKREIFNILKELKVPLSTYLNNVENLKFKCIPKDYYLKKYKNSYDKYAANTYNAINNTIYYQKEYIHNKAKHELFHVASSYFDDKYIYYGFSQIDTSNNQFLNLGMMEAYTQYLYKKYVDYGTDDDVYIINITLLIPLINMLGEDTFNKFYFNMNLKGLIKELRQYIPFKDIICLMKSMDYILYNYGNKNIISQYRFVNCFNYAKKVVTAILLSGAYQNYYNKIISKEDMKEVLYELKKFYTSNIHSKKFKFISKQENKESFNKFQKDIRVLVKERNF